MTAPHSNPPAPARPLCGFHWIVLAILLAAGAALRFHGITRQSQWPDEFWSSVHLATGRGTTVFNLPDGILFNPPPPTLLQGAPSWPHIWTGLNNVTHPPLYLLLLRAWMNLFGDADFSTRAFSAIFSLAGIIVLFDILRRLAGPHVALLAAAFMALSGLQIDYSQQARPYTLLAFFGLLACHALIRIERKGATPSRLIQFAAAIVATALTHYFAFGALLALTVYVALRLRGDDRRKTLAAIAAAALFTLVVWGPFFLRQRHELLGPQSWSLEPTRPLMLPLVRVLALSYALLYGRFTAEPTWIATGVVAYLLPLFFIRRFPQLLLWWLWVVGIIGSLLIYDSVHHARLLAFPKYTFLASVGLYALFANPLPVARWWKWAIPYALLAGTLVATLDRLQIGSFAEYGGDWRALALKTDRLARPGDPLVFYLNPFWGSPAMFYLAFTHYVANSHRPVMFLRKPADARALARLAGYKQIWLIGPASALDGSRFLPGWKVIYSTSYVGAGDLARLVPANSSPAP